MQATRNQMQLHVTARVVLNRNFWIPNSVHCKPLSHYDPLHNNIPLVCVFNALFTGSAQCTQLSIHEK